MVLRRLSLLATCFAALLAVSASAQEQHKPSHKSAPAHKAEMKHKAQHRSARRRVQRHEVVRADHSRVVAYGHRGYVEHPYNYRGHTFYSRAVYVHGHYAGVHYYRSYAWHGYGLHVWAPGIYYSHGFYGWAYHPWRTRVYYHWGWAGAPWYGYYGYYYQPYPYYAGASQWLTDYTISQDLAQQYDAQPPVAGEPAPSVEGDSGPLLTPDAKNAINDEVEYELAVENGEADLESTRGDVDAGSSGIPRVFVDSKPHAFVVSAPIDVTVQGSGEECSLTPGDVLSTTTPPAPDDKNATMMVLASKGEDECEKSSAVAVSLDDLQEMQNSLRQTVHDGLKQLQDEQGKNGIPALPAGAAGPATTPQYAAIAPPPDPNDGAAVEQQAGQDETAAQDATPATANQPAQTQAPAPIERH